MSPEVWLASRKVIEDTARANSVHVEWPNEDNMRRPPPPAMWIAVEGAANTAGPLQIGYDAWNEHGQIFVHVMVPVGQGVLDGFTLRKVFSTAFRGINFTGQLPVGLIYMDDQSFDLLGPASEDGVYVSMTLVVRYTYQDKLTNPPPY